jgi:23S rRNA (cytosine1962-C5)-methyltransferase
VDGRGRELGVALWSPKSEIALRLLDRNIDARIDADWFATRIRAAANRRSDVAGIATGFRVVHGEGDALPSFICDRYSDWIVVQLLSAGLESFRPQLVEAIAEVLAPAGILARNDAAIREREGLSRGTELLAGDVPRDIEITEHGLRYLAAPWDGQKTGAFLDQRENRARIGAMARGRALDCFCYHGSFALHLARRADTVVAVDSSQPALERARRNSALNSIGSIEFVCENTFDYLRAVEERGERFDTIVLDPPAFAKSRATLPGAIRGYKDINLRAMRLLAKNGVLFTASCSFHLSKAAFLEMLDDAAADSGRRLQLLETCGQPVDHPEILGIPETGYLKGAIVRAVD